MSIISSALELKDVKQRIADLQEQELAAKKQALVLKKELIGQLDRAMVESLGDCIESFDVDGLIWYRIPMILLGVLAYPKGFDQKRIEISSISGSPVSFKLIDESVLSVFTEKELKEKCYYLEDAVMLTDCKGHQIHTKHSWEGFRATPHWDVGGFIAADSDSKSIAKTVRYFQEELCSKQKEEDVDFLYEVIDV